MSGSSPWQDRVRERMLAYVMEAAQSQVADISAAEVNRVLEQLSHEPGELRLLRQSYFLMHSWEALRGFFVMTMPKLVRSLRRASQSRVEALEGAVQGSIDWGLTVAARANGSPRTAYVCVHPEAYFSTPENQALVYLLTQFWQMAGHLLKRLVGAAEGSAHPEHETLMSLGERAAYVRREAAGWLNHVYLRGVAAPDRLGPVHRVRLAQSRNPLFRPVGTLLDRYEGTVSGEVHLPQVLRETLLLPASADTLFELYALMAVVDALPSTQNWTLERRLIWTGRWAVARAREVSSGQVLEVFYNQSLLGSGEGSAYHQIFAAYDLDVYRRRPDITLRLRAPGQPDRHIIVEVKRTGDRGYIVDSVYKVLGYLQDFQASLGPPVQPQAVLVVEDGIRRLATPTEPVAIVTPADIEAGEMRTIISTAWATAKP